MADKNIYLTLVLIPEKAKNEERATNSSAAADGIKINVPASSKMDFKNNIFIVFKEIRGIGIAAAERQQRLRSTDLGNFQFLGRYSRITNYVLLRASI